MRTTVRSLTLVLVLAMVAVACGGSDDAAEAPAGQAPTTAASLDPNAELKVGLDADQIVTEGVRASLGLSPNVGVTEMLTSLSETYEVKPGLAERWEFRAPNTWRFFIRKGVRFHDGQPLDAKAVKEGLFDRLAKIPGGSTVKAGPESVALVDEFTLDFTPTVTNLRVPEQIVHPNNGVTAPGTDLGKKPVGTGAFRFVEYLPKERLVLERNPDYWGDKAKVARLTFRFYPDSNARLLALQAGDIDVATQVPRPDAKALKDKGFTVLNSTVGAYEAMYVNVRGSAPYDLLADPNLRRAVALGIDRKKLVDGVLDGLASMDQTFVPPSTLGRFAGEVKGFQFDPNRARTLLDQAGWRPGSDGIRTKGDRRLKLTIVSGFPTAEVHRPIPTFLQSEFKNLGIELEIVERPDSTSFYDLMKEKKGDLWLEQGNQNDANPGFLPVLLFYTAPGTSSAEGQTQGISGPGQKFNDLLTPSLTEADPEKARAATAAALHEMIDEQVTVIPLAGIFQVYGAKKTVQGFVPHPSRININWAAVGVATR